MIEPVLVVVSNVLVCISVLALVGMGWHAQHSLLESLRRERILAQGMQQIEQACRDGGSDTLTVAMETMYEELLGELRQQRAHPWRWWRPWRMPPRYGQPWPNGTE